MWASTRSSGAWPVDLFETDCQAIPELPQVVPPISLTHRVAAAMIDRLVHHAEVLTFTGDSYRTRTRRELLGKSPTNNTSARPSLTWRTNRTSHR